MKYYTFYRENNEFEDILADTSIKKAIDLKISWSQHLMIGLHNDDAQIQSLLTLKYGDEMIPFPVKDFSPKPNIDYTPKDDATKYSKAIKCKKN